MNFVLKMALRELKASWKRLVLFFVCIAIGVGAIVTLRSLIQSVRSSVTGEAQSLMAGDIEISSSREWTPEVLQKIQSTLAAAPQAQQIQQLEVIETPTMSRAASDETGTSSRIELRGVPPGYPFYGTIQLEDGGILSPDRLANNGIVVQPALLVQLNVKAGDEIKIGTLNCRIQGVIQSDPASTLSALSFGPRVFMSLETLKQSGLIVFGTRARYRLLLKVPEPQVEPLFNSLKESLKGQLVSVNSYRNSQNRITTQFNQAEDFLSLAGLIVVILGGIGVSSVIRVYITQRFKSIAILKCLGSTSRQIISTYLTQVLLLALAGSALGIGVAYLAVWATPRYFLTDFPIQVDFHLTASAIGQGLGIGVLIALLFSLVPLLDIRSVKPNLLLRGESGDRKKRFDLVQITAVTVVVSGLLGIASWQAGSIKIGAAFLGGLAITALLLFGVSILLVSGLRKIRTIPRFVVRQGITNLYRPGNQTRLILLTTGLGVFFIIAVNLIQTNLLKEFNFSLLQNASDMFLIDIQQDQRVGLVELVRPVIGTDIELVPSLRARLIAFDGKPIELETVENASERNRLGREYTVTYSNKLGSNEQIVDGKFWDATPSTEPEVSIEEMLYQNTGLKVGSTLTVDILGRRITAKITSLRKVDWRNSRTGFVILFRPGVLDTAPHTYLAGIKGPTDQRARSQFQTLIIKQFPNITVIDALDIINRTKSILSGFTLAVSFIGGFVFLCGVLILVGSIAMTKYHRVYETAILKTLGAKRKAIILITLVEYGLLGLLAGTIGSSAALGLAWAVSTKILQIDWHFYPSINIAGVVVTMLLVVFVGVVSTLDIMVKKPLGVLRGE